AVLAKIQAEGRRVCFVGDGINDALALRQANVSVSLAGASTVATDAASIVLMDGTLRKLVPLLDIAKELEENLDTGSVLAIAPGVFCVGGIFLLHFGLPTAVALCNLGLFASVTNAMLPAIRRRVGSSGAPELTPATEPQKEPTMAPVIEAAIEPAMAA
ncbi:MAG TPA: hypothetical protein PLA94_24370, partial [Myxococcota bacterium]|nr:hypothetical protein [Myxococcota bacterium]